MKRLIFFSLLGLTTISAFSQTLDDALRYSQTYQSGTARFNALGGAYGALGADFSSLSVNPAGIGVYRSSEFTITPVFTSNTVKSTFLGNKNEDFKYSFNLGNLGMVLNFNSGSETGWVSSSFGVGYNQTNNFNSSSLIKGINSSSSIADYFMDNASGTSPENLSDYYERLAFDAYVIDTLDGEYVTPIYWGNQQKMSVSTSGYSGELVVSFGANYSNTLYLGATLGFNKINYSRTSNYSEDDVNDVSPGFEYLDFREELDTRGTGYTLKLGAIYKPIDIVRVGLAFHLPGFYSMTDEYCNSIKSQFSSGTYVGTYGTYYSPNGSYDYSYTTPYRAIGSVALVVPNVGLLSVDAEYVDYSTMRYRDGGDGYDYSEENSAIESTFQSTVNLKAGAEVRLGNVSFRGGYNYNGNPYKNGDYTSSSYTGGIGIRSESFFIDAAYVYRTTTSDYLMYNHSTLDAAELKNNLSSIMVTLGYKF
jgi:hypothetical protein